ncbi:MAG: bifunctional serine/threonine-protein kinase/formylglycine-generating enzyme family protein, partial [Planctomycetota bacterium]
METKDGFDTKDMGEGQYICPDCHYQKRLEGIPDAEALICPECAGHLVPSPEASGEWPEGPDPLEGQIIGGCRLEKKLGVGGMGFVYKAVHLALNRTVAVKFLAEHVSNEAAKRRFLREARAAAKLVHANIVPVYNTGVDKGRHFIVMQFIEGESVSARVKREGPIPLREAIDIAIEAARGITAAHHMEMIHRDIKPDNLLMNSDGDVKVTDFGLAKDLTDQSGITMSQQALGTPHYMSPEQASDAKAADKRSDIYAFGATLYTMFAGTPPYHGTTPWAVISLHMTEPLPDIREKNPDVPETLWLLLQRMMAKDPEDRFPDMDSVLEKLLDIRRRWEEVKNETYRPADLKTPPPPPPARSGMPPAFQTDTSATLVADKPEKPRAFPILWVAVPGAAGIVILLVLAGLGVFSGKSPQEEPPEEPPPIETQKSGTKTEVPEPDPVDDTLLRESETALQDLVNRVDPLVGRGRYGEALDLLQSFPEKYRETPARERCESEKTRVLRIALSHFRTEIKEIGTPAHEAGAKVLFDKIQWIMRSLAALSPHAKGISGWEEVVKNAGETEARLKKTTGEFAWIRKVRRDVSTQSRDALETTAYRLQQDADGAVPGTEAAASTALAIVKREIQRRIAAETGEEEQREKDRLAEARRAVDRALARNAFPEALALLKPFLNSKFPPVKRNAEAVQQRVLCLKKRVDELNSRLRALEKLLTSKRWVDLETAGKEAAAFSAEEIPGPMKSEIASIQRRVSAERQKRVRKFEEEGFRICPGGRIPLGSPDARDRNPPHLTTLKAFLIGTKEVTHREYAAFIAATGHPAPPQWPNGDMPDTRANHPVTHVSAEDVQAYCQWRTQVTGWRHRLPTADEWEAASGWDGKTRKMRRFPWG